MNDLALRAKAIQWDLGTSKNGNEQIAVLFKVTDEGEYLGKHFTWYGYFTEKTIERTFDSLRYCGWDSDSIAELDNLGTNEVVLILGEEADQEGVVRLKVKFVNRVATLALKNVMDDNAKKAFAARLKGAAVAHKRKFGAGKPSTPPQQPAQPRNGAAAKPPRQRQPGDDDEDLNQLFGDDNAPF